MKKQDEAHEYLKIADHVMRQIMNREVAAGQKVASISQLAKQFKVYRSVAERALKRLENLGWVTPVHGKGYFVSERPEKIPYYFSKLMRYTNNMARLGKRPNAHLLDWCQDTPTELERDLLSLSESDKVYRLEILRLVGSIPQNVATSSLPERLVPGLERYLADFQSLYTILETHYQFIPVRLYSIIETRLPQDKDAEWLGIPENMPTFYKINLNVHPDGTPAVLDIGRARGDMTQFIIEFPNGE